MNAKVKAIYGKDIDDLADQLNNFSKNTDTVSTQVFQTSEGYDALIYYYERDLNVVDKPIVEKEKPVTNLIPITEGQIKALIKFGYEEKEVKLMTKKQAWEIINKKLNKSNS